MKVIAVLEVDEEKLAETGHSFEDEIKWSADSGITLTKYVEADKCSEYEYVAFAWNDVEKRYEQMGRPVITERLCRARFNEYVEKGWFACCYDTSRVVFKKRLVSVICTNWEELEENQNGK